MTVTISTYDIVCLMYLIYLNQSSKTMDRRYFLLGVVTLPRVGNNAGYVKKVTVVPTLRPIIEKPKALSRISGMVRGSRQWGKVADMPEIWEKFLHPCYLRVPPFAFL